MRDLIIAWLVAAVIFLLWYSNYLRRELFRWVRELQEVDSREAEIMGRILKILSHQIAEERTDDGGNDAGPEV